MLSLTKETTNSQPIAHTRNDHGEWHFLIDHLTKVAKKTSQNTTYFRLETPAFWIGLWHDLGKANPAFQEYLYAADLDLPAQSVPHAFGGAALIYAILWGQEQSDNWKDIALPIAGHHAGLHDAGILAQKLDAYINENQIILKQLTQFAKQLATPKLWQVPNLTKLEKELLIRMTFSALVDADYLDTEAHFDSSRAEVRANVHDQDTLWQMLWQKFEKNQEKLLIEVQSKGDTNKELMSIRKEIYEACISSANSSPGFYRLTVPTGGGKTRSGLAFALQHILCNLNKHNLRRIIIAIPYTSIIDQTAREYRRIFGHNVIIEHHSHVQVPENESQTRDQIRLRLASENWDVPIIVTTNVQFFESLFSNRPGKVRKLHNIAGSVIILDEVQTLPTSILKPTLDVLQTLVNQFNVSVVLSSATQPAFNGIGQICPKDIIPRDRFNDHFKKLARVNYIRHVEKLSWSEIAIELQNRKQVMIVLNSRKDALQLLNELKNVSNLFHLSTLLCSWHRKAVLRLVRSRLRHGLPVLLVSTQVVEAGVDIDFPEVWRALGPLDRIVQAAGRCNREGKMPSKGQVVIFEPIEGRMPRGEYRAGFGLANFLINQNNLEKLHDPALHEEYFKRLYAERNLDEHDVQIHRETLNFPETARRFRLISEDTVSVVVEYDRGRQRLADWMNWPSRIAWRRLQPYTVSLQRREADRLHSEGWLEPLNDGLYRWTGKYDKISGLVEAVYDPADLII